MAQLSKTWHPDYTFPHYLGHLGQCDTYRIIPTSVVSQKVVKAVYLHHEITNVFAKKLWWT